MRVGEFRDTRERRIVLGMVYTVAALAFAMLFGIQAYRRHTLPHSVATILEIREEERDGGRSGHTSRSSVFLNLPVRQTARSSHAGRKRRSIAGVTAMKLAKSWM
ncbi:hypothetical protein GGE35_004157 [Rhizobium cellulosilyticum]|uniref:Uncharacterized protein n=1 Tax=Aliirhizobium cellulosilyticum TaxID=393664 RepID=A0A7W6THS6_9HYPH|nr:hypothetical protein [Rhizobium cellulosilyticum]MBB4413686.1 hypothetical protein [Rhizobium cellulosilyticum]MBB4448320.1 hypothetical protein [Rhizobium cellulosilyticum]